jgi:hypothetical protein
VSPDVRSPPGGPGQYSGSKQPQDVEQLVERVALKPDRGYSPEDLYGVRLDYSSNQSHADRLRANILLSKRVPVDIILTSAEDCGY